MPKNYNPKLFGDFSKPYINNHSYKQKKGHSFEWPFPLIKN